MNAKTAVVAIMCAIAISGLAVGQTVMQGGNGKTNGGGDAAFSGANGATPDANGGPYALKTLDIKGYPGIFNTDKGGSQAKFHKEVKVDYSQDGTDVTAKVDLTEGTRFSFFWLDVRSVAETFCTQVTWTYMSDHSSGLETVRELDVFFDGAIAFSIRDGQFVSPQDKTFVVQPGQVVEVTVSLYTLRDTKAKIVFGEDYALVECGSVPKGPCGGDWFFSTSMRWIGRSYNSLVMQARTENYVYVWGTDGYYGVLFLAIYNLDLSQKLYAELFGSWDSGDTGWHTLGMMGRGTALHLTLDGATVKVYDGEYPVTSLMAAQLRPGWITISEVDWAAAAGGSCGFFDDMNYGSVEEFEAGGWVILQDRDLVTAASSTIIMDDDGARCPIVEREMERGDP
jgi:hypothetical protein